MPRYTWECKKCKRQFEVECKIADSDKLPENVCGCEKPHMEKILSPTKFVGVRGKGRWQHI